MVLGTQLYRTVCLPLSMSTSGRRGSAGFPTCSELCRKRRRRARRWRARRGARRVKRHGFRADYSREHHI